MTTFNRKIGVLSIRLLLGFIFLMQGFGKVFTWGVNELHNMHFFKVKFEGILPEFLTLATAYYTSYIELIGGLLLVIGFKRDIALYFLASVLVIVTFGHGLTDPIWDLSHLIYRAILLLSLLLLPKDWDQFSLDYFINKKK